MSSPLPVPNSTESSIPTYAARRSRWSGAWETWTFLAYSNFRHSEPEAFKALMGELREAIGFDAFPLPTHRDDQVWVNNWVLGRDCLDVDDITWTEVAVRKAMLKAHDILKRRMPGFERELHPRHRFSTRHQGEPAADRRACRHRRRRTFGGRLL